MTLEFLRELQRAGEPEDGRGIWFKHPRAGIVRIVYIFFNWIPLDTTGYHMTYLIIFGFATMVPYVEPVLQALGTPEISALEAVPGRLQPSCFGARETVTPAA